MSSFCDVACIWGEVGELAAELQENFREGNMTTHFIAVLVPERRGGWSVLFPDLPGCATHGASVHETIATASDAAAAWLAASCALGDEIPAPRSYEDVRADDAWAQGRGVDWSTAVVSLVAVACPANDS